jgi:hypothetical protein
MTPAQRKLFKSVVSDGLAIQSRFSAAPVYGPTGKGHLESEGVKTLSKIKAGMRRRARKVA